MQKNPHILLALSGHGFGHLAQCAPVINTLWQRMPALQLTVCSQLDERVIRRRLDRPFNYHPVETDPVLPMRSAWEVDVPAVCAAYADFHHKWDAGLAADHELIGAVQPDLLLANIPWRLLLAAQRAGVPGIALCSLNWATVYERYCNDSPESGVIARQMWQAYRAADVFLRPEPALPMPELDNTQAIGPIARLGTADKSALLAQLSLPADSRLVLVALGGIPSELPLASWPLHDNTVWLFPQYVNSERDDMLACNHLSVGFIDLLASCDTVLTKPGYGTYAEAVCNAVPILTLERPDWPETASMNNWAQRHGRLLEVSQADFAAGNFAVALDDLWQQPAPLPPQPDGAGQAAGVVAACLGML